MLDKNAKGIFYQVRLLGGNVKLLKGFLGEELQFDKKSYRVYLQFAPECVFLNCWEDG